MPRLTLAESQELQQDAVYTVSFPTRPTSAVLHYVVTGPWQTGLLRVIVNGNVVKDYSGWWGLWPFTGSDSVDVTSYVDAGNNKIIFEVKTQWLIITTIGPALTAYLDYELPQNVQDTTQVSGGQQQDSGGLNVQTILILLIMFAFIMTVIRR